MEETLLLGPLRANWCPALDSNGQAASANEKRRLRPRNLVGQIAHWPQRQAGIDYPNLWT